MRGCRQAGPFQEPFDWRDCGVLDYPWIVTNPMDLGTVERQLCTGRYCSAEAFARDMRLIFSNALVFNSDVEEPIHQVARGPPAQRPQRPVRATRPGGTRTPFALEGYRRLRRDGARVLRM